MCGPRLLKGPAALYADYVTYLLGGTELSSELADRTPMVLALRGERVLLVAKRGFGATNPELVGAIKRCLGERFKASRTAVEHGGASLLERASALAADGD